MIKLNKNIKKVCLLSDHHICINPRLWKEAFFYENLGFEVVVLTMWQSNMFLEKGTAQQAPQATSSDIEQIQESVGGTTEYQNMIQWASQNLSEQETAMYDAVMDRGDPLAMFFAAQALNARYQDAVGYDGEMLTGSAPRNSNDAFRSQAELVAAMSDPRYDKDPAYRADVADKLERSNINF